MIITTIFVLLACLVPLTDQYMDLLGQVPVDTLNQILSERGMSMEQAQQLMSTQEGQQLAQQFMTGQISLDQLQGAPTQNTLTQQADPTYDNQFQQNYDNNEYQLQNNIDPSQNTVQQSQYPREIVQNYEALQQQYNSNENDFPVNTLDQSQNQEQGYLQMNQGQSQDQGYLQVNQGQNQNQVQGQNLEQGYIQLDQGQKEEQTYIEQLTNRNNNGLEYVDQKQPYDPQSSAVHNEKIFASENDDLIKDNDQYINQQSNNIQQESVYSAQVSNQQNTDLNKYNDNAQKLSNYVQNDNQIQQQQEEIDQVQNNLRQDTNPNSDGLEYGIQKQSEYESEQSLESYLDKSKDVVQSSNYEANDQNQTLNRLNITVSVYYIPSNSSLTNGFYPVSLPSATQEEVDSSQNIIKGIITPDSESLDMQEDEDIFEDAEFLQPVLGKFNVTAAQNLTQPKDQSAEEVQQQELEFGDEDEGSILKILQKLLVLTVMFLYAIILQV